MAHSVSFGRAQGVAAQSWVEAAVESGDASSESLMQMQLALFDECKVDDDTGRCKALSEAIEALDAAVAERKNAPKKEACALSHIHPHPKARLVSVGTQHDI